DRRERVRGVRLVAVRQPVGHAGALDRDDLADVPRWVDELLADDELEGLARHQAISRAARSSLQVKTLTKAMPLPTFTRLYRSPASMARATMRCASASSTYPVYPIGVSPVGPRACISQLIPSCPRVVSLPLRVSM